MLGYLGLPDADDRVEAVDASKHIAHGVDHGRYGVDGGVIEEQ